MEKILMLNYQKKIPIYLSKSRMMGQEYQKMNMIMYLNHFIKLIKAELKQNLVLV